jgi:NTP pyrophosphatase (non-canonical NTP hydrolase)
MNTLNEYQAEVKRTAQSAQVDRSTFALGLAGESGEVCDLLKKAWGHGHVLDEAKLKKELGDVLWYVAALGLQFGINLQDIAEANVAKLRARYPDGFSTAASIARVDVAPAATSTHGEFGSRVTAAGHTDPWI